VIALGVAASYWFDVGPPSDDDEYQWWSIR